MTENHYLVDNNALVRMGLTGRTQVADLPVCHIPEEVLYEARFLTGHLGLTTRTYPVSSAVLRRLPEIMAALDEDAIVVDLYKNQGNADPILVATAIQATCEAGETLFPEHWFIVTEDLPLRRLAGAFEVGTLSLKDFEAVIEARGSLVDVNGD